MKNNKEVKRWEFNDEVTEIFDDMLVRSIPQYEVMRKAIFSLGQKYVQQKTEILDLGSSRGESISEFIKFFGAQNNYVLSEVSEPMLDVLKERFGGLVSTGILKIDGSDITRNFPRVEASLILSILTIQFTPIENRQEIIQKIYDSLLPNGAFIFVEKVLGSNFQIDEIMVEKYYELKKENGYSLDEIDQKREQLKGSLVPVTAKWNEELLTQAGFRKIDCFWRWMNFSGWIAIK